MLTLSTYMKAVIMAAVPLISALALYAQTGEINAPSSRSGSWPSSGRSRCS